MQLSKSIEANFKDETFPFRKRERDRERERGRVSWQYACATGQSVCTKEEANVAAERRGEREGATVEDVRENDNK